MMKKKIAATKLLFATLFLNTSCYGQTISEQTVLSSVSTHFPLIIAAQENIKRARAEYLSAQGAFDPLIRSNMLVSPNGDYKYGNFGAEVLLPIEDSGNKLFTGYRIGRGTYPVYDQNLETYNYGEVRAGIEIPFMRDHEIDLRRTKIKQSGIDTNLSLQKLRMEKLKAEYDASLSYWDWYTAGKQLLLQQHMLKLAEDRQAALSKSVHAGDIAEIDAIDNNRAIMQRKAIVKMNEALFAKASLVLSLYYRDQSGHPIIPSIDNLPAGSNLNIVHFNDQQISQQINDIINTHPSIRSYQEQYNSSLISLKQANNDFLPKINNRFYLAQDLGGGNPPLNKTTFNYELSFELPINQREARGQITAAEKQMEKLDQERRLQAEQLTVSIKKALIQLEVARKIIELTRKEAEMAAKVESAENVRYIHGDSNLFMLNQREVMTAEAQTRYLEAVKNYYIAVATLHYSLGPDKNFS